MIYNRNILIENILKLMKDNNSTQHDLAIKLDTYQSRISKCLRGEVDFTIPQLVSIADFYNVSLDSLIDDSSDKERSINSLSDLYSLLFSIFDNLKCHISNESVDDSSDTNNFCIVFEDDKIQEFLSEWKDALEMPNAFSNGKQLYTNWKTGVLSDNAGRLKKFSYRNISEHETFLLYSMFDHIQDCLEGSVFSSQDEKEARSRMLADLYIDSLSDEDREILSRVISTRDVFEVPFI